MHQERTQTATPDGAARAPVPDRDDWTVLQSLSEELALRERILHAVSFAVQRFLREGHWGDGMEEVLARLGEATDVSRIYIFANHTSSDGALLASLRYEWVAEGIEPQIRNPELQDVPFAEAGMGRWERVLGSGRVISGNVSDFPESERGLLEAQDIRSLLVVPVFLGDRWWGFMGYDECRRERPWSSVVAEALSAAADTLGTAIQRRDTEAALRRSEAQLRQAQKMEALGRLAIRFGGVTIAAKGEQVPGYDEAPVARHLAGREIVIDVDVAVGKGAATVWTCDLTHGYIDINGSYRS